MRSTTLLNLTFLIVSLTACSSSQLKFEKVEELKKNTEFEKEVQIVKTDEPVLKESPATEKSHAESPVLATVPEPQKNLPPPSKKTATKKAVVKKGGAIMKENAPPAVIPVRQPELEDHVGFEGDSRRPIADPFRVGEDVVHDVHYFKVSAGTLRFKVEPFSIVNGRKSYTYAMEIKTSPLFSSFYSVDDRVETFVDYEDLVPRVFQLHVKETNQLREAKMLFNTETNTAKFWEKKVTKADGEEEKRQEWEILPFTQNVYSAIFYMRNFQWEVGKEYAFRVGNDKENLVFSGKAVRREVLDTKLGPMKAIVVQINVVLKGKFKPIGDNFIWLSDDDRKFILRIESKIKIGSLVSEVISLSPGKN